VKDLPNFRKSRFTSPERLYLSLIEAAIVSDKMVVAVCRAIARASQPRAFAIEVDKQRETRFERAREEATRTEKARERERESDS